MQNIKLLDTEIIFSSAIEPLFKDLRKNYSKTFLITDENLASSYAKFIDKFAPDKVIAIKAGEKQKNFKNLQLILESILAENPDRESAIIGFGGGVIGDIAGLSASLLLRGVDFIQIPTSLLSMVDSSIGGKTAINSTSGKNLIGSFYQAKKTIINIDFLLTLSNREFLSGYAEILKIAMTSDKNFYDFLLQNSAKLILKDRDYISKIIYRAIELKSEIVTQDFREGDVRKLLNFGHSYGHSFEKSLNYSAKLRHGEAVALGIIPALYVSKELYSITDNEISDYIKHLKDLNLFKKPSSIEISTILENMKNDKKNSSGMFNLVLLKKLGEGVFVENIEKSLIVNSLNKVGFK